MRALPIQKITGLPRHHYISLPDRAIFVFDRGVAKDGYIPVNLREVQDSEIVVAEWKREILVARIPAACDLATRTGYATAIKDYVHRKAEGEVEDAYLRGYRFEPMIHTMSALNMVCPYKHRTIVEEQLAGAVPISEVCQYHHPEKFPYFKRGPLVRIGFPITSWEEPNPRINRHRPSLSIVYDPRSVSLSVDEWSVKMVSQQISEVLGDIHGSPDTSGSSQGKEPVRR